jgi:uncharacterized protein YndB with AHSA1/START domain
MMPVKKDASGRRYVEAEAEVPGTPEQVWEAIATGHGISSWFVPTDIEEVDGTPSKSISHFGADASMDAVATITAWEPPRRFVAESPGERSSDPTIATEWTVDARSGGTCVVRVVHSWFATGDDWDQQFEGHAHGWVAFFRILRLYLTYFRGQRCAPFQLLAFAPGPTAAAWAALTGPLGLSRAVEGQHLTSNAAGAPRLSGHIERVGPPEYPELLARLDEPTAGIAHLFAMPMAGSICVSVRFYFYGEDAPAVTAREEPAWRAWLDSQFAGPSRAGDNPSS